MIVRDNAVTLTPCLASIRPWVDEMVVVDTGSRDDTPLIAQDFGARLFHFPWGDDFSAPRNESLRHARGQWLFWMDSDDTIDAENGRGLRELANGCHEANTLGYVMQVHCPARDDEAAGGLTVVDHVKMFRNHPDLRFEFRIHEQVLPSIRRLGGEVVWTDLFVDHSGADHTREGRQRKYDRDLRILGLELQDKPDHPFVLFNLGMTYSDMGDHRRAAEYLERCLRCSHPEESHVRKAHALLVSTLAAQGHRDEAWQACCEGRKSFPDDPELLFRQGMAAHALGRLDEAEQAYRGALANREERHFSSVDPGIIGYKARHNLALVYEARGRDDLAELQWRQAVAESPAFREGQRCLGESLLRRRRYVSAEVHIENMLTQPLLRSAAKVLRAQLAGLRGEPEAARRELEDAVAAAATSSESLQPLCRLLFEHGHLEDARQALHRLVELCPEDGAAHHNLGLVYLRLGQAENAIAWLRESLRLRPKAILTWEQLAQTLDALGRPDEAVEARQQAQRIGALVEHETETTEANHS
jgi:tetratricopeptide (TPR) repeat protein